MTFRHCTHYGLKGDERTAIAKMLTILEELESEINDKQSDTIGDGVDIITESQINACAELLQSLLNLEGEEVYFN